MNRHKGSYEGVIMPKALVQIEGISGTNRKERVEQSPTEEVVLHPEVQNFVPCGP